jgi:MoaA/NifB/PqqE/SkfB family radical SAM enzyme
MNIAESDRISLTDGLSFLWLEITAKCNLFCSHCYADSGPQEELYGRMTFGDWARVIDDAAEAGCRSVQFIGGEPTLHPRLHDLIDRANHRGFEFIEVFTNATRIGRDLVACFQRYGVHVATSFYSDDPAIHERITNGHESWQRTVRGVESVVAAGLPIRVGVIETEANIGHGPRAIEFLKGLGVREIRLDRKRGVGRGGLIEIGDDSERYDELCGQCWKGRLCVTSSGDVFPCVFSRATRLGDIRLGLSAILQTSRLADFRRKVRALEQDRAAATVGPAKNQACSPPGCGPECAPSGCGPGGCPPTGLCDPSSTCTPTCSPPCAPAN